jgi:citrate synthase
MRCVRVFSIQSIVQATQQTKAVKTMATTQATYKPGLQQVTVKESNGYSVVKAANGCTLYSGYNNNVAKYLNGVKK